MLIAEQVAGHAPAFGLIGVLADKQDAAVGAAHGIGFQHLLDLVVAVAVALHLFQHGKAVGFIVADGEGGGVRQGDGSGLQGVQNRGGQACQLQAAINMLFIDAKGHGDGWDRDATRGHVAIFADFIGGVGLLPVVVLARCPNLGGRRIRGQLDRDGGKARIVLQQFQGAKPAASGHDPDFARLVAQARKVLDQAKLADVLGQGLDAFRAEHGARVQGRDVKISEGDQFDGAVDRFVFHGVVSLSCGETVCYGCPALMAVGAGRAFSKCAVLDQEAAADTKAVALPDKRPRFCETALQGFTAHESGLNNSEPSGFA